MAYELFSNDNLHCTPCKVINEEYSEVKCEKITAKLNGWKNALFWNIATLRKVKAYVVYDGEKRIHISYVIHGREKFTFLGERDIEIGPCWTHPEYRGYGIYPAVLSSIIQKELSGGGTAYMIIHDSNEASQKGVAKAGFEKVGVSVERDLLKRYRIKER